MDPMLSVEPGRVYDARVNDVLVLLIIALVVVLMLRGPKMLPRLGEALGRGVKDARKEARTAFRDEDPDTDRSSVS
jgi:Sec-independent protein translocase protein TatA